MMKNDNGDSSALALEQQKTRSMALKLALYEDLILHQTEILQQNQAEIDDYLALIKFQAQYNDVQSRKLMERSHELRTYYNAIQGLSEVTRLVMFSDLDQQFHLLGVKVKEYDQLIVTHKGDFDHVEFALTLAQIEKLQSNITKSLIQASANLVIIEQSSKAGIIYTSLILDENELALGGEIHKEAFDFDALIAQSIAMFQQGKLAMKHIALKCKLDSIGQIESSSYHLKIIINNLLANAINYTPNNGDVTVIVTIKIEAEITSLVIIVQDTGEGINDENIAKIRQKFQQSTLDEKFERYSQSAQQGTGFGLVNVLRCVTILGGEISVKSGGLGKGSTFVVTIPLG